MIKLDHGPITPRLLAAIGVVITLGVLGTMGAMTWFVDDAPPERARVYTEQQACLLTGKLGLADPASAPIWAGMQDASAATDAKVSYLAVAGEPSFGSAAIHVTTLVARRCTVIIGLSEPIAAAIRDQAPHHPDITFITLDGAGNNHGAGNNNPVPTPTGTPRRGAPEPAGIPAESNNLVSLPHGTPDQIRDAVHDAVTDVVG